MLRKMTRTALISSCLFVASITAEAAVYDASFETNLGSQTFTTPMTGADSLAITGLLDNDDKPRDFSFQSTPADYSPQNLRNSGVR